MVVETITVYYITTQLFFAIPHLIYIVAIINWLISFASTVEKFFLAHRFSTAQNLKLFQPGGPEGPEGPEDPFLPKILKKEQDKEDQEKEDQDKEKEEEAISTPSHGIKEGEDDIKHPFQDSCGILESIYMVHPTLQESESSTTSLSVQESESSTSLTVQESEDFTIPNRQEPESIKLNSVREQKNGSTQRKVGKKTNGSTQRKVGKKMNGSTQGKDKKEKSAEAQRQERSRFLIKENIEELLQFYKLYPDWTEKEREGHRNSILESCRRRGDGTFENSIRTNRTRLKRIIKSEIKDEALDEDQKSALRRWLRVEDSEI